MSDSEAPPRIGVSQCLLGERVRYDGGHKDNDYVRGTLGRHLTLVPACPEVAIGLGVPRPPIRLVREANDVRVRGVTDPSRDVTDALTALAERTAAEAGPLDGYVFKSGSPSCGVRGVPVHDAAGRPLAEGAGRFANEIMARCPLLPVTDEQRLADTAERERFLTAVYAHWRWRETAAAGWTPGRLVAFHRRHKYLLQAHDESQYRELGRLVAQAGSRPQPDLAAAYAVGFMAALARPATRGGHVNVLQHLVGHLKERLYPSERKKLLNAIERYAGGEASREEPLTLLRAHLRHVPEAWASEQVYLAPYPAGLSSAPGASTQGVA